VREGWEDDDAPIRMGPVLAELFSDSCFAKRALDGAIDRRMRAASGSYRPAQRSLENFRSRPVREFRTSAKRSFKSPGPDMRRVQRSSQAR
jgi:hypothetical protein